MNEYIKMKLWGVSFWKHLFRKELISIFENSDPDDYIELLIYCYNKYSDMHPEILAEVFAEFKTQISRPISTEN